MSPYRSPVEHSPSAWQDWDDEVIERVAYCDCCGSPRILVPSVICEHCGHQMPIRAYVFRRAGKFYAECLTFNLLARGETQEEAIRRLQIAMFAYLRTALGDGTKSVEGLVPRRAPFSSWVRYGFLRFKAWVSRIVGRDYPLATRSMPKGGGIRVAHC